MAGIVTCSTCVYLGKSNKDATLICRRRSPVLAAHQQNPAFDYVPATWPAVDEDDGCGDGATTN